MSILAEISDKMPTALELWIHMAVVSLILAVPGLLHKFIAILTFIIGIILSILSVYYSYYGAFVEPHWCELVQTEMGYVWIIHDLISSFLPGVFTGLVLRWHLRKRQTQLAQTLQECHI